MEKKKLKLVNLTPHSINFVSAESSKYPNMPPEVEASIPPSGTIARVSFSPILEEKLKMENGYEVPVIRIKRFSITNLPDPQEGVGYIVSKAVAEAARERKDLYTLFHLKRDRNGQVLGGASLSKI